HEAPGEQEPDRVRELEGKNDVRVIDFAPTELYLQRRLEDSDHLPVDVVDRRCEKQQAADGPAEVTDRFARPKPRATVFARLKRCATVWSGHLAVSLQIVGLRRWMANSR